MNKSTSAKNETPSAHPSSTNGGKHGAHKPVDDSQHGKGLMARVTARKAELEAALKDAQSVQAGETEGNRAKEIDKALSAVATLLTGDLTNIDDANAVVLSEWMETSAVLVNLRPAKKAQPEPQPVPKSAH